MRTAPRPARMAAQRSIFHVQRGLEEVAEAESDAAIVLCDRGTIDGAAYWPEPTGFFEAMGTTRAAELARYHAVVHLRTPAQTNGYDHANPARIETATEALEIDRRIADAWEGHPRRVFVECSGDFLQKAARALDVLRGWMPACCRTG